MNVVGKRWHIFQTVCELVSEIHFQTVSTK